jgi:hypothetical protein
MEEKEWEEMSMNYQMGPLHRDKLVMGQLCRGKMTYVLSHFEDYYFIIIMTEKHR